MKRYINIAIIYAILAMIGGVFYREFTKFNEFTHRTALSFIHTHYFMLGMFFFLILFLLEKNFAFTRTKTKRILICYHVGLNLTVLMLLIRGIIQVLGTNVSSGLNATLSGLAGIGHIILGVSLVLVLLEIRHGALSKKE